MKLSQDSLVMVLDGTKLFLFRNVGTAVAPELITLVEEEEDNPPSSEQGTDRPGRTHSRVSDRRSGYDDTDWHEQSKGRFVRHAADVLEHWALKFEKSQIVVIAAPRALGELRKHYGSQSGNRISAEINKDLAGHMADEIIGAVTAHEA